MFRRWNLANSKSYYAYGTIMWLDPPKNFLSCPWAHSPGTCGLVMWAEGAGQMRELVFTEHLPPGLCYLSLIFTRILSGQCLNPHFIDVDMGSERLSNTPCSQGRKPVKGRVCAMGTSDPTRSEPDLWPPFVPRIQHHLLLVQTDTRLPPELLLLHSCQFSLAPEAERTRLGT